MISEGLQKTIIEFELSIQRRECFGSVHMANETLNILKSCVMEFNKSEDIEKSLLYVTKRLRSSFPFYVIVSNYCNRVIDILNQELNNNISFSLFDVSSDIRKSQSLSLLQLFGSPMPPNFEKELEEKKKRDDILKTNIINGIDKLLKEIPSFHESISKYGCRYIHDGDLLMTVGSSSSVYACIKKASHNRNFSVIIPEQAPSYDGIKMANRLHQAKIDCAVIPDSAVFAIMPRITTIFCPCRAIFADGTLVTNSNVKSILLAAKHYAKPFIVVYWKPKLTQRFVKPKESFTVLASPSDIISSDNKTAQIATILNPDGECISVHNVTLFINESGPHGPAEIFSLVHDFYDQNS